MALKVLLSLGAALVMAAPLTGQQRMPADPDVVVGVLPNGLRYYVRANHQPAHRAELRLLVNAGSILEDSDQAGLAHFVEHMAFNGTAQFPKQELVRFVEGIGMTFGADLNAETSFDDTRYRLTVPTDSAGVLEKGVEVLHDWAGAVSFDPAEIQKERGVVIEEWRLGQGAGRRLFNQTFPVLLGGSRYAERLPIGNLHSLQSFPARALTRFYRDWYRPDLMAVVAVGDFDRDRVVALIRGRFGALPARKASRPRPRSVVAPRPTTRVAIATDPEATRTLVELQFLRPAAPQGTVAAFRTGLLSRLYDGMLNQRLAELAQRANPPFIGAGAGQGELVRPVGAFTLAAAVTGPAVIRGFDAALAEVERVRRFGFVDAEFDRARKSLQEELNNGFAEREHTESSDFADEYADNFLTGAPFSGIGQLKSLGDSMLAGITLPEVNRAAHLWLESRDRVITLTGPERLRDSLPSAAALLAAVDSAERRTLEPYREQLSDQPLVTQELPEAAIVAESFDSVTAVTRWTLANGVHVVLKPTDFKADEVQLSGFSPGGLSREPDSLAVASAFVGAAIGSGGLGQFSAIDLDKKLAGRRVGIGPWISGYQEGVSGSAAPADLAQLFELTWLLFNAPRVDSAAFAVMHANAMTQLSQQLADPGRAFRDTVAVTLGQHHLWSLPLTTARADSVTIDKVYALYRNRFADAADFTFVMVGNFTPDSVRGLIRRYLGTLPAIHRDNSARDRGITAPAGVVSRQVRRGLADRSNTTIVFSGDFAWSQRERGLLNGVSTILQDRLRKQLREELGATYSVSVSGQPTRVPRPTYQLRVDYGSAPARVTELAGQVQQAADSLRTGGPTAEEVNDWKETVRRSHQTALRENDYWITLLSSSVAQGETVAALLDVEGWLAPVSADDLRQAAGRFLDARRYVQVTLVPADSSASSTR